MILFKQGETGVRKSYKCNNLETTIHFLPDAIKFCCTGAEGPGIRIPDIDKLNLNMAEAKRISLINNLMKGKIPHECEGCGEYKERTKPGLKELIFGTKPEKKINKIIINHFKECNCDCIHCTEKIIWQKEIKKYDVLPVIRELYKNNALSEDVKVEFQGGSVGVWQEFEPVLKELQKQNCKKFDILTNGTKYEPLLGEIAKTASVNVSVSLDCGTREKFKEIKRSDCFDTVIENIYKYIRENINVQMKYILLEDINDNIEEITKFLDTARAFGCMVIFDADYRQVYFGNSDKYVLPEKYISLISEIKKYCNENNMNCILNEALQTKLDKSQI